MLTYEQFEKQTSCKVVLFKSTVKIIKLGVLFVVSSLADQSGSGSFLTVLFPYSCFVNYNFNIYKYTLLNSLLSLLVSLLPSHVLPIQPQHSADLTILLLLLNQLLLQIHGDQDVQDGLFHSNVKAPRLRWPSETLKIVFGRWMGDWSYRG